MKILVTYFSAEMGRTKALAEKIAEAVSADIYEIKPEEPYTKADVSYMNPMARCNREKISKKDIKIAEHPESLDKYDMVLIGFPIWYGCAPNAVNSFCKELDFTGKKVAAFATSGGSGIGKSAEKLSPYVKGTEVTDAKLFNHADKDELTAWVESL